MSDPDPSPSPLPYATPAHRRRYRLKPWVRRVLWSPVMVLTLLVCLPSRERMGWWVEWWWPGE